MKAKAFFAWEDASVFEIGDAIGRACGFLIREMEREGKVLGKDYDICVKMLNDPNLIPQGHVHTIPLKK